MFREAEHANLQLVLNYLSARNDIRLIGPDDAAVRAPTVAFTSRHMDAEDIAIKLADHGVMAGAGNFYAMRPMQAMGIDPDKGAVRLSFVHYTSRDEINQMLTALDQIL